MRINTNTAAMNTYSNLTSANASKSGSLAKLSSGLRINKAGDDAAGLAISEKMKNQISGMTQASRNAQDGISLIQTAEGALGETHSILNRMRDLTVQAGNGTNTGDDKDAIQKEIDSLTKEVNRIATDTKFNTKGLLSGVEGKGTELSAAKTAVVPTSATIEAAVNDDDVSALVSAYNANKGDAITAIDADSTKAEVASAIVALTDEDAKLAIAEAFTETPGLKGSTKVTDLTGTKAVDAVKSTGKTSFTFQIGANASENIDISIANMTTDGLGISDIKVNGDATGTFEGENMSSTDAALKTIDKAIATVSTERANLGAVQNRLDHTVSNLATTKENLSEANSRITDVDMAEEMMSFTKSNILSQASTSMLAQANQMPQSVLSLLQ